MAIYVTSDAHGHVRALDEALSKISLTSDDTLYVPVSYTHLTLPTIA